MIIIIIHFFGLFFYWFVDVYIWSFTAKPRNAMVIESSDEDYDEEMDDFIDDGPIDDPYGSNISSHIRDIFGYDRRK